MNNTIKPSSFKLDLEKAKQSKQKTFFHNGAEYLVEYAEYLVEYMIMLENQNKNQNVKI